MSNDQEKAELCSETFKDFFDQFGNDEHAQFVLELLFEELMNVKAVSLFSEPEQKRN